MAYEESYGYMLGSYVRDKDAVTAAVAMTEMAAYYAGKGMTLYDALMALWVGAQDEVRALLVGQLHRQIEALRVLRVGGGHGGEVPVNHHLLRHAAPPATPTRWLKSWPGRTCST